MSNKIREIVMQSSIYRAAFVLAMSTVLCSTVACVGANPATPAADSTKKSKDAKDQGASEPRPSGKRSASLTMSYSPENIVSPVGTLVRISVSYRSSTAGATSLTTTMTPGAGLSLEKGAGPSEFVMDGIKVTAQQDITVRVDQPGLHYVNVFAELTSNGKLQRRNFAIPVSGSGDARSSSGNPAGVSLQAGADGRKVVSQPAEQH